MAAIVSLRAVADEMEILTAGMHVYLNRRTGEFHGGTDEQLAKAEEDDEDDALLTWEVEIVHKLREVLESPDWLELPARHTHEEYRLMERFCLERCEGRLQEELLSTISGRGAFGRFKDCIHRRGVQEDWYDFRRTELATEAAEWLEAQGIAYGP
jgi:hypothetical protein